MLAAIVFGTTFLGVFSLMSFLLGVLAFRRLPIPRSKHRQVELIILGLPVALAILFSISLFIVPA
ncbi:MAG: hypothetical protein IPQ13_13860 [Holophagaceae bacterium]|nr:hypothetical protein [Holophagaceae bacterium]